MHSEMIIYSHGSVDVQNALPVFSKKWRGGGLLILDQSGHHKL